MGKQCLIICHVFFEKYSNPLSSDSDESQILTRPTRPDLLVLPLVPLHLTCPPSLHSYDSAVLASLLFLDYASWLQYQAGKVDYGLYLDCFSQDGCLVIFYFLWISALVTGPHHLTKTLHAANHTFTWPSLSWHFTVLQANSRRASTQSPSVNPQWPMLMKIKVWWMNYRNNIVGLKNLRISFVFSLVFCC